MFQIKPITELRNNFAEISKIVHEKAEPIFLTKNGYGDMVVMSIELFSKMNSDSIISEKLKKAGQEAKSTNNKK